MPIPEKHIPFKIFPWFRPVVSLIAENLEGSTPESITEMQFLLDTKGVIREVNEVVHEILGFTAAELIGKPFQQISLTSGFEILEDQSNAAEIVQSPNHSLILVSKSGIEIPVTTAVNQIRKNLRPCFVVSCSRLPGKTAPEASESLQNLMKESLFQMTSDLVFLLTAEDGKLVDANEAFFSSLGFTRDELIGKPASDDKNLWMDEVTRIRILETIRKNNLADESGIWLQKKDGLRIAVVLNGKVSDYQGNSILFFVAKDVTRLREIENSLTASVSAYNAFSDLYGELVLQVDQGGQVICSNPGQQVLNPFPELKSGDNLLESLPAGLARQFLDAIVISLNTETKQYFEFTIPFNGEDQLYEAGLSRIAGGKTLILIRAGKGKNTAPGLSDAGRCDETSLLGIHSVIAERDRIQQELEKSERKFRSLFDHAVFGISITHADTREVIINPAMERMLGYSKSYSPGNQFLQLCHPDDFHALNASYSKLRNGTLDAFSAECRLLKYDGNYLHGVLFVGMIKNNSGADEYMIESILDITERKQSEIALAESENRYRILFRNSRAVILVIDPDSGKIIDSNEAAIGFYGYTADELRGIDLSMLSLVNPFELHTELTEAAAGQEKFYSARHRNKAGRVTEVEVFTGPIIQNGKPCVYQIIHDQLSRKEADDGLNLLWNAIEHVAEGVVITDKAGTIKYVNPSYASFMGYETEEVIGQNPRIFSSGKQSSVFYEEMYNLIHAGNTWQGQIVNKKKDGTLVDEFMVISPVKKSDGTIKNFVSIKRDITRELQMEKELRHGEKMQAIGTLAGGIAHDFNNILQIIQIYSELLLPDKSTDPFTEKNIEELNKAVNRGKELVHAILTYSRKTDIELAPQPCEPLIRESLAFIRAVMPPSVRIVEELTPAGNILCNATNIQQIIMNLATNSVTAMNDKGLLTVTLTRANDPTINNRVHPGAWAFLEMKDSGVGMDEEIQRRIFEPFFTTKQIGNGTGLGLSTVLGIVEKHNGHIECESTPGVGSAFKIYFPIISTYESTLFR
jgi:PAS domain S-box-containing protein